MIEQLPQPTKWYADSILIKLAIITVIILLLLIPSGWVQDLTADREGYQQENLRNVADKWAGTQLVQGPVLVVPYKKLETVLGTNQKATTREIIETLYVLPETLKVNSNVKNQLFESGLYDAIVYNSDIGVQGNFLKPNLDELGISPDDVLYDKARLIFGVSDLKGLKNSAIVKIDDHDFNPEPAIDGKRPFDKCLQVLFPLQKDKGFSFNYQLELKGCNELNFLNTGKITDVQVTSDWHNPGFNGRYLPDSRTVTATGFIAKWRMLYYNRPFPQQWVHDDNLLMSSVASKQAMFGIKLQLPIDQYRKILRTNKYSTLIILLTFMSLFLAEMIKKQDIHPLNYILIGAAMVVYYILLLSLSEQVGYNYAYLIASAATILLIAIFTGSLLKNKNVTSLFALILAVFYGFIYVIIQLEQLSLLFGSIALFIIIALLMFFSRKINWDKR